MTMLNTNDADEQHDSPPGVQAGQASPASGDDNRPPASEADTETDAPDDQDDDDNVTGEARKYRKRAQKAEAERDAAQEMLTKTRQFLVNNAVASVGYTPKLAELIAADMDALLDENGLPDTAKVYNAITSTAAEYGITRQPRPPRNNDQQGRGTSQPHGESSWSSALKGR
jgi:hypothetical protein